MIFSGSRFGVARWLSVKKELIVFGYPSGVRGPQVAGIIRQIVECGDLLVKGFLRVMFGGLADTVGFQYGIVASWW